MGLSIALSFIFMCVSVALLNNGMDNMKTNKSLAIMQMLGGMLCGLLGIGIGLSVL